MTATQPDSEGYTRRGVMRATAVGIGATATVGVGVSHPNGMVQESKALAPLIAGGFLAGVAIDWALREYNVYGSDAPAEGLTADALKQQVYQAARARRSNNASTFVDNKNILDGVEHTAYTEAKIAAIEQLNAGATETEVLDAATAAIDSYQTTVQGNFLKSWIETTNELQALINSLQSHPETVVTDVFNPYGGNVLINDYESATNYDLPDGTTLTIDHVQLSQDSTVDGYLTYSPLLESSGAGAGDQYPTDVGASYDGETTEYIASGEWKPLHDEMETTFQNVRDGISTWVTSVYGDVQSGEIEISDLVTPRERAAMMAEEEGVSQALADLIALNIPVDLEREATVFIPESGTTLRGSLGLTDTSDGPIEAGATYDPSTFAGDVYFTTDVSLLEGEWDAFETGVDGGTVTLTAEPYEGTVYTVETTAPETVNIPAADFTDNGDGTWSYDASGDLETPITEVSAVNYYAESDETNYQTIQLDTSFTVEGFENTETGESADSASFTSAEPQNDSNYITQDEWDSLEQQNQELIDKFEESQSSGGTGGAGGGWFEGDSPDVGLIAAVVGGAGVVYALFGQGGSD